MGDHYGRPRGDPARPRRRSVDRAAALAPDHGRAILGIAGAAGSRQDDAGRRAGRRAGGAGLGPRPSSHVADGRLPPRRRPARPCSGSATARARPRPSTRWGYAALPGPAARRGPRRRLRPGLRARPGAADSPQPSPYLPPGAARCVTEGNYLPRWPDPRVGRRPARELSETWLVATTDDGDAAAPAGGPARASSASRRTSRRGAGSPGPTRPTRRLIRERQCRARTWSVTAAARREPAARRPARSRSILSPRKYAVAHSAAKISPRTNMSGTTKPSPIAPPAPPSPSRRPTRPAASRRASRQATHQPEADGERGGRRHVGDGDQHRGA